MGNPQNEGRKQVGIRLLKWQRNSWMATNLVTKKLDLSKLKSVSRDQILVLISEKIDTVREETVLFCGFLFSVFDKFLKSPDCVGLNEARC